VFLSYRREDSKAYAGRIFDRLNQSFGAENVFMDISRIGAGSDFVEAIRMAVGRSDALIAVIGRHWADITDEKGRRRLDDSADFVRLEVATALARGTRVVPVLVDDVRMPSADALPDDLKRLARIQAIELSDERWAFDMDQLVDVLRGSPSESFVTIPRDQIWRGPEPRSFLKVAWMVFTWSAVLTTVLFGAVMTIVLSVGVDQSADKVFADVAPWAVLFGLRMGLVFGVIGGSLWQGRKIIVNFGRRDEFITSVNVAMSELAFSPAQGSADVLSFRASSSVRRVIAGPISVILGTGIATIVGPAWHIGRLKTRLEQPPVGRT
jgi:TIR domain